MKRLLLISFLFLISMNAFAVSLNDIWHMDIGDIISTIIFWYVLYWVIFEAILPSIGEYFEKRASLKPKPKKLSAAQLEKNYKEFKTDIMVTFYIICAVIGVVGFLASLS